jgi:glycerol-3-phosphate dehydrogenase (NAD(P)+)
VQAAALTTTRCHARYLPNIVLPENLFVTSNLHDLAGAQFWLFAVPTEALRDVAARLQGFLPADARLLLLAKGLEQKTHQWPTAIIHDVLQNMLTAEAVVGALSGPGFAIDIAAGKPAAVSIAATTLPHASQFATIFEKTNLRPYASDDLVGVQLAGALKNVVALAAGVAMGAGLGESARAAIITRGLAETQRLGLACGAKAETFMGLSGLGDLALSATSAQSRNYQCGLSLGQGQALAAVLRDSRGVVEGVKTAAAALALGAQHKVELPIAAAINALLAGHASVAQLAEALMARPLKTEHGGNDGLLVSKIGA